MKWKLCKRTNTNKDNKRRNASATNKLIQQKNKHTNKYNKRRKTRNEQAHKQREQKKKCNKI